MVFSRRAANDINSKSKDNQNGFDEYDFKVDNNAPHIPTGLRTEIRKIMQSSYFVIPQVDKLKDGLAKISEIKDMLDKGNYKIDRDYVEARSLATVAFIVLTEANKIASGNAELIYSEGEEI